LWETGSDAEIRAALGLVERLLRDYPNDFEVAPALDLHGQCLERLGDNPAALVSYRRSVEEQRRIPSMKTDAYLRFAWLVAREKFSNFYEEALQLLNEFRELAAFPVQRFRQSAAQALIAAERGDSSAGSYARAALAAAVETSSGFRYHQDLGLVAEVEQSLERRLREIAAG
jgi:tetratricopeptide (TPR) repeat protein